VCLSVPTFRNFTLVNPFSGFSPGPRSASFWGPITLRANIRLKWSLKKSCNLRRKLSNGMSHITCTQGNQGNSWLLVVGNQIVNLVLAPSFVHSLCLKYLNGSCEPILNIYVLRAFQWYMEIFNPLGFIDAKFVKNYKNELKVLVFCNPTCNFSSFKIFNNILGWTCKK
jgi:hypothetical protein